MGWSILKLAFDSLATTMTFSIEQLGEIDNVVGKWCVARVPPELKSQIDLLDLKALAATVDVERS